MGKVKKILNVILAFLILNSTDGWGQLAEVSRLIGQLRQEEVEPKPVKTQEEIWKKFRCPSCDREFEIKIDPEDIELKKGIKKIICPYDGTEFYPRILAEEKETLKYYTVRCPKDGKEFKAYIDIKGLLSGAPQVLICPYDKTKFYFKAETFKPGALLKANLFTVICPNDRRTFKAYINPENPGELTCPYDGTRFFPTRDLIIEQIGIPGAGIKDLGKTLSSVGVSVGRMQGAVPIGQMVQATSTVPFIEEPPSRIEQIFSKQLPLSISKHIKQFGYEIFRPSQPLRRRVREPEISRQAKGTSSELKLLRAILGSEQQPSELTEDFGTGGGYSYFTSPAEIPAITDYVLGPGDSLKVTIWGQIQQIFTLTIDSEGKVLLPKIGPVYLWGLNFGEAERLIKEKLSSAFANIQISVSMGRLRGIKVFVLGEAKSPGAYTVSALSNSFHAIYAAAGPKKIGSMRKIKLIRKGSSEKPIDLYNILIKGDNTQDYKLRGNDIIFIPPIGAVVGIAGNVKRPAIYELKEKIKLSDLIELAGGFTPVGYLQRIQLERIEDHRRKIVSDLEFKSIADLKKSPENIELQDGDLVLVFPIVPLRYNYVSISGNVLRPGDYEFKQGLRLKELIDKAGGILPGTYLRRAEIARFKGDQTRQIIPVNLVRLLEGDESENILLNEWDVITIYSKKDVLPQFFVEIDGAVHRPGRYELTENMTISDLVFRAGGLKRSASLKNAELFRIFSNPGPDLIKIDLDKILVDDFKGHNKFDLTLEPGDHLFVRELNTSAQKIIITLSGEFKYPGKYAVEKGTHLSEVIKRAGGFTENAFLDGAIYTRESVKVAQRKMIKNFLASEQEALLQEHASLAIGLGGGQAQARNQLIEYRKKLIEKIGTIEVTGRILIRLNKDLERFAGSEYDVIIEDGDTLHIPTFPSTVQVIGNVYGPGTVTYSENKGVDYYINKVGGLQKYADAKRIFIIRANGETVSRFVRAVRVKRGDTIVVPEEFKYRTLPGLFFRDIVQTIYQIGMGAIVTVTALNTL